MGKHVMASRSRRTLQTLLDNLGGWRQGNGFESFKVVHILNPLLLIFVLSIHISNPLLNTSKDDQQQPKLQRKRDESVRKQNNISHRLGLLVVDVALLVVVDAVGAVGDASLLNIDFANLGVLAIKDTCNFLKSWTAENLVSNYSLS